MNVLDGGGSMDFVERARIRMEHWVTHNDHHLEEYGIFAEQLEDAGIVESGGHIREMIVLAARCNDCLRKALASLK